MALMAGCGPVDSYYHPVSSPAHVPPRPQAPAPPQQTPSPVTSHTSAPAYTPPPAPPTLPPDQAGEQTVSTNQAERLQRLMVPLLDVMDHPIPPGQARISVIEDPDINAGSAGSGQFIVTTGLLTKANDVHLEAVLAHEVAHDDLGHVAEARTLSSGMDLATIILDQIFPGSGQVAPIVGTLAIRAYSRQDEYEADMHGVELLRRLHPNGKEMMVDTLVWLEQTSGRSGGGYLSTHPASDDRIDRVRNMP